MEAALYIIDVLPLAHAVIASEKSTFLVFCVSILLKEGSRQLQHSKVCKGLGCKLKTTSCCQAFCRVNSVQQAKLHFQAVAGIDLLKKNTYMWYSPSSQHDLNVQINSKIKEVKLWLS